MTNPPPENPAPSPPSLNAPPPPAGPVANQVPNRASMNAGGVAVAVVDANAVIHGDRLAGAAERYVSVQEVLDEVRDPSSRRQVAFLPFDIETIEPSPEFIKKGIYVLPLFSPTRQAPPSVVSCCDSAVSGRDSAVQCPRLCCPVAATPPLPQLNKYKCFVQ